MSGNNANTINHAILPVNESSLSVKDANEMIADMLHRHAQSKRFLITAFSEFAQELNAEIKATLSSPWVDLMEHAASAIKLVTSVLEITTNPESLTRATTALLALSFVVQKTPTLNFFRKNARQIVESNESPMILSESSKSYVTVFLDGIFALWLSYDQLDASDETRVRARSAMNKTMESQLVKNKVATTWMGVVMQRGFESAVSTEVKIDIVSIITTDSVLSPGIGDNVTAEYR
jgi:hypothetical protein